MTKPARDVTVDRQFQRRDRTRPDVVRNRGHILTVAGSLFARDGLSVSMKAIMRATGLGNSTLYRHYATKTALVADVLRGPVASWAAAVSAVPDDHPGGRFAAVLRTSALHQARNLALAELLTGATPLSDDIDRARTKGRSAIAAALQAAVAAGEVTPDISEPDVDLLTQAITGVLRHDEDGREERARRLVDLFLRPAGL